jgi:hypothetical protein
MLFVWTYTAGPHEGLLRKSKNRYPVGAGKELLSL